MKKIATILFITLGYVSTAQFDFGVKLGLNSTRLNMDDVNNPNNVIESLQAGDMRYGFQGGLFSAINFLSYQVRIEAYYSSVNVEYRARQSNNQTTNSRVTVNRFDFPVLFGLKFGPVRANLGPVLSYNVSSTNDVLENGLRNGTVGGQVGLGVDFWKMMAEVRYEMGLSRFANQVNVSGQNIPTDSRVSLWTFSVGYKFF
ncbi:outer membrane beta-barrel protein [Thermaurantimonas aggregans]|uniref:outer membrane beta-barrel protein n=1 Tax=Thermaurantimonas aggregans TaxID=2173829 RepID=UPI0023F42746|nr:outer membrane beta-barrel protein [Thermaurantimonas aggregans]MCX8149421.1 PorT family protein [Thermaurantimonas aggregans]